MNTQVKPLTSQLQARLAHRAAAITNEANWAKAFRAQEQMADYRHSKQIIAELTEQQVLDKELLNSLNEHQKLGRHYTELMLAYREVVGAIAELED